MNKRKYLIIGLVIYIILIILNSFYVFNGAFEWFGYFNPFDNFYAFLVIMGIIIYLLVKKFGYHRLEDLQTDHTSDLGDQENQSNQNMLKKRDHTQYRVLGI